MHPRCGGLALAKRSFSPRSDQELSLGILLARRLSVRRCVLDFRVQLRAREYGDASDVQPEQNHDHTADGTVRPS